MFANDPAVQFASGGRTLAFTIPANTRATVKLPQARLADVMESGEPLASAKGVASARQDGAAVEIDTGSGQYRFSYAMTRD